MIMRRGKGGKVRPVSAWREGILPWAGDVYSRAPSTSATSAYQLAPGLIMRNPYCTSGKFSDHDLL